MGRKPLTVAFTHFEPTGIHPELMAGLSALRCPEDEDCSVQVNRGVIRGVSIFLKRQKSVPVEPGWVLDHDAKDNDYPFIYAASFETESAQEIIEAVRHVLNLSPRRAGG
jgi:hypothetical protein